MSTNTNSSFRKGLLLGCLAAAPAWCLTVSTACPAQWDCAPKTVEYTSFNVECTSLSDCRAGEKGPHEAPIDCDAATKEVGQQIIGCDTNSHFVFSGDEPADNGQTKVGAYFVGRDSKLYGSIRIWNRSDNSYVYTYLEFYEGDPRITAFKARGIGSCVAS